ncbi:MAG: threonine synthase [Oscillospiraceae bacterium]|nr:threonine synthase [Oscillospiraceae bacterium]
MRYFSTRDKSISFSAAEAIKQGLSRDGGLFLPEKIPAITAGRLDKMCAMSYRQRAVAVMKLFLEDYTESELAAFADAAYSPEKFDSPDVAPVRAVDASTYCLELWHGPTSAFKDMALQMLPHLLSAALKKTGETRTACILVATSGDTGKAALEGFRDVPHTKILVFYPRDGVSEIQKLQMVTQEGKNVGVCSVVGNFDDAQTGVKRIFSDEEIRKTLNDRGYFLSSANSINWGRVLPQIIYYVSVWCDLRRAGKIGDGEKLTVCVPTGNFGNILSAYYAKLMGVPIGKLVCASNCNDVLTEFLRTGVYNRNRPFHTTMSPSMDILISSNLERLLFLLSGGNDAEVRSYMDSLAATGMYKVSDDIMAKIKELFWAGSCDEAGTSAAINEYYTRYDYLIDPHSAVAASVLEQYRDKTGDSSTAVFASTASPYKFCGSVLRSIGEEPKGDGIGLISQLQDVSGVKAPERLASLGTKEKRFDRVAEKQDMDKVVLDILR